MVWRRKPSRTEGKRGGEHERGNIPPLIRGGLGENILSFERFYVLFNGGFMSLGQDFGLFGHNLLLEKIFLVT